MFREKERLSISYFKTGMCTGGATMADVRLLEALAPYHQVNVMTGIIDSYIKNELEKAGIGVELEPLLDRMNSSPTGSLKKRILELLKGNKSNRIVFSQPFCGRETTTEYDDTVTAVSKLYKTLLRIYDNLHNNGIVDIGDETFGIPSNTFIAQEIQASSDKVKVEIIPPCVDFVGLKSTLVNKTGLRSRLDLSDDDVLFFQPTRLEPRKGIIRAINLLSEVQKRLRNKNVCLCVCGGKEKEQYSKQYREEIETHLQNLDIKVIFIGGVNNFGNEEISMSSLFRATDFVTFMSDIEGWGLPPLEAAIAQKPCITRNYTDNKGNPIFNNCYEGFEFIVSEANGEKVDLGVVDKILEIIHNPQGYDSVLRHNRDMAEKKYRTEIALQKLLKVLE